MSRVAQWLTDRLLPGIITTTSRARYYSLYPWILWHVRESGEGTSFDGFRSAFQRREAAIAIATILDGESNPVGVDAARLKLTQAEEDGAVNVNFKVLPANPLGGFGQYYSGCLYQLGLTEKNQDGIDIPSGTMADRLAQAVQQTLSRTLYITQARFTKASIPLKSLIESRTRLSLDALGKPYAKHETNLIIDLLFGFGDGLHSPLITAQRQTLAQLLWTVSAYQKRRIPVHDDSFQDQVLYWPTYFSALQRPEQSAVLFEFPGDMAAHAARWRQFCLHCYLVLGLEGLLESVLQLLATKPAGATLEAIAHDLSSPIPKALEHLTGKLCKSPGELLELVGINSEPNQRTCHAIRRRLGPDHKLNENVYQSRVKTAGERAARAAALLAILYGKWRGETGDEAWLEVNRGVLTDLCAPSVLGGLDRWLAPGANWEGEILQLIRLIAETHDRVMFEKGRLESCWLDHDAGRYRRAQDYETYRRAPRLGQAASILADLHLLSVKGSGAQATWTITSQGEAVLERSLAAK